MRNFTIIIDFNINLIDINILRLCTCMKRNIDHWLKISVRNSLFVNEIVHLLLMQLVAGHQVTRNYTFHFHFRVPYDIIQGVWEDCNAHQMHIRWRTSYYWIGHLEWKENQKSGKICHRANSSTQGKMKESPLIDTVDHLWIIKLRGNVCYLWFWWNNLVFL